MSVISYRGISSEVTDAILGDRRGEFCVKRIIQEWRSRIPESLGAATIFEGTMIHQDSGEVMISAFKFFAFIKTQSGKIHGMGIADNDSELGGVLLAIRLSADAFGAEQIGEPYPISVNLNELRRFREHENGETR